MKDEILRAYKQQDLCNMFGRFAEENDIMANNMTAAIAKLEAPIDAVIKGYEEVLRFKNYEGKFFSKNIVTYFKVVCSFSPRAALELRRNLKNLDKKYLQERSVILLESAKKFNL